MKTPPIAQQPVVPPLQSMGSSEPGAKVEAEEQARKRRQAEEQQQQ